MLRKLPYWSGNSLFDPTKVVMLSWSKGKSVNRYKKVKASGWFRALFGIKYRAHWRRVYIPFESCYIPATVFIRFVGFDESHRIECKSNAEALKIFNSWKDWANYCSFP